MQNRVPTCPAGHSSSPPLPLVPQDSPTTKPLYNKEVQGYKAQVKNYYQEVRQLPWIPKDAMQYYLKQLSGVSACDVCCVCVCVCTCTCASCYNFPSFLPLLQYQSQMMRKTGGFVTESALHELLRYATKYHEPVSTLY